MANPTRIEGDVFVAGNVRAVSMTIPAGAVGAEAVAPGADLPATKLRHEHRRTYAQESATEVADEARVVHVVRGVAAEAVAFVAGVVVPATVDDTATVDLLKNGVSILTAPISLSVAQAAYEVVAGAIATAALVAEDVLEVVIAGTHAAGVLPKGVFASRSVQMSSPSCVFPP
ncbi:unnamed protein product [marine sediment metagenome]|uniref:Uncharacterized protein n=1 Tax=marine sediment metagenome TaxID=412755 RepID=X1F8L8_9ZZZZ